MSTIPFAKPAEVSVPIHHPIRFELILFGIVLAFANATLLWGEWNDRLVFFSDRVAAGEWWRILTHSFAHVSWYHLLLDGSAFLMLYAELVHWSPTRRLGAVVACATGSLLAAMLSPVAAARGFCGLSGVAHGLMAIAAVEMIRRGGMWERRLGWLAFAGVVAKAAFEAVSGNVVLSFMHFGLMGVPVAVCHAGGVIGGLALMGLQASARAIRACKPRSAMPLRNLIQFR